jgi:hypothetical protein
VIAKQISDENVSSSKRLLLFLFLRTLLELTKSVDNEQAAEEIVGLLDLCQSENKGLQGMAHQLALKLIEVLNEHPTLRSQIKDKVKGIVEENLGRQESDLKQTASLLRKYMRVCSK